MPRGVYKRKRKKSRPVKSSSSRDPSLHAIVLLRQAKSALDSGAQRRANLLWQLALEVLMGE